MKSTSFLLLLAAGIGVGSRAIAPAQEALQFGAATYSTAHREWILPLQIRGPLSYRLEWSTNLVDWAAAYSGSGSGTLLHTSTPSARILSQFYRARQLEDASALTGDHFPTADGEAVIHPIHHASLLLAWQGRAIYSDPVNTNLLQGLPKADLILLTHTHSDHLDAAALNFLRTTRTVVAAPRDVYNTLSASLKTNTLVLTNGAATNALGVRIEAVPMYNLTTATPFHVKGAGNGYLLTLGGRRIYISGDTENSPEMKALKDIDVAFLSVNQPYSMTVSQAVNAVNAFLPGIVYPFHHSGTDVLPLKRQLEANPAVEVRLRKWY